MKSFLTIILVSILSASATSQVTLQVGGGLGILMPRSDYGGSTIEYYRGTKYGLSNGINLQAKARLRFIGLSLVGEVDYSSLRNSGNSEPNQGRVEVSQKVYSLKVGPELQFKLPALPVTPYLGANAAIHRFSGETTFQGVSKVPSATYVVQSASRLGIGASGGVLLKLYESLFLDLGLHYNLMNISGKSWEDVNPLLDQRLDSYLALNDERDPAFLPNDDKHFIAAQRAIHSLLLTATIMFSL